MKATKEDLRHYIRKFRDDRRNEILNEEKNALCTYLHKDTSPDEKVRSALKDLSNALHKLDVAIDNLVGLGLAYREDLGRIPNYDNLIVEMTKPLNKRFWRGSIRDYEEQAKDRYPKVLEIARPFEEDLMEVEKAYRTLDRIIDKAANGDKAAQALAELGYDYYKDVNPKSEDVDVSILKKPLSHGND